MWYFAHENFETASIVKDWINPVPKSDNITNTNDRICVLNTTQTNTTIATKKIYTANSAKFVIIICLATVLPKYPSVIVSFKWFSPILFLKNT